MKIKRFLISPKVLPMLFEDGLSFKVDKGIPQGAKFKGYAHDPLTNCIVVFVEHESYKEVDENKEVPVEEPLKFSRIDAT